MYICILTCISLLKPLLKLLVTERSYPLSPCISNEGITINLKLFSSQRQWPRGNYQLQPYETYDGFRAL